MAARDHWIAGPPALSELPTYLIIGTWGKVHFNSRVLGELLLLYRLNRFGPDLFILDLRSIPAPAERFYQVHGHHYLLSQ